MFSKLCDLCVPLTVVFSNCELAFTRAAEGLGVAALLEPEDVAR